MSNIFRKELNEAGVYNELADLRSVKLAGAQALEKDIPAAQTVEQPGVNTTIAEVTPVQPVVNPTMEASSVVSESVPGPAPQQVESVAQQTVVAPTSIPEIPNTGVTPEVYNPIQSSVLDDAQQKIETPIEFSKNTTPMDNVVQFPGTGVTTPTAETAVVGENVYNAPAASADVKVVPFPGAEEDKRKELRKEFLKNIESLLEKYDKSVQELNEDKKAVDAAMTGLDQVQATVNQGSQILNGQPYNPTDMTKEEGMSRAA
jgi:hypothetical protein